MNRLFCNTTCNCFTLAFFLIFLFCTIKIKQPHMWVSELTGSVRVFNLYTEGCSGAVADGSSRRLKANTALPHNHPPPRQELAPR